MGRIALSLSLKGEFAVAMSWPHTGTAAQHTWEKLLDDAFTRIADPHSGLPAREQISVR
ncbi:hypothetical protein ABZ770_36030 [Streptomyces sp. NPDC006654]|uniref:hypothetical protein n=1 Tax=Streptomyces sp. NPDC006654 TaxID=3156897 RepID=UPI0033D503EE